MTKIPAIIGRLSFSGPLLAAVLYASISALSAPASDMPSASAWHDVRVLGEFTRLDFAHVDTVGEDWAVIRVAQGPPISDDLIPDEAAGQARKYGLIADLVNATADPVATLRGTVADGPWPCFAPVPANKLFGGLPITMVDRSTGTCVCRVNNTFAQAGRAVLQESRLIPDDWVAQVKPAFEQWRDKRDVFTGPVDPRRHKQLLDMTKDTNPVIAFMAYRRLAESGQLTLSDVPPETLEARTDLGIFVTFLLLYYTPEAEQDALFQQMVKQVDSAKAMNDLHGIATACALDVGPRRKMHVEKEASYHLLAHIETRIADLLKDGKKDDYLVPAMRELRKNQP